MADGDAELIQFIMAFVAGNTDQSSKELIRCKKMIACLKIKKSVEAYVDKMDIAKRFDKTDLTNYIQEVEKLTTAADELATYKDFNPAAFSDDFETVKDIIHFVKQPRHMYNNIVLKDIIPILQWLAAKSLMSHMNATVDLIAKENEKEEEI